LSFESFLNRPDFKLRLASILSAGTFILGGILLALSIGAALFQWTFINTGPGRLLTGAYGTFAFIIPVYLFWAAWILITPVFKPGRIFVLSATVIPFLTLALGFSLIRDFEIRRQELVFLDTLGRSGLSLVVITAAVLECMGILILHSVFFSSIISGAKQLQGQEAAQERIPPQGAVPPDFPAPGESAAPSSVTAEGSGALSFQTAEDSAAPPAQGTEPGAQLPEWKPLASSAAFRELEEKTRPGSSPGDIPVSPSQKGDDPVVLKPSVFAPYSQVSSPPEPGDEEGQFTSPVQRGGVDFTSAGVLIAVGEETEGPEQAMEDKETGEGSDMGAETVEEEIPDAAAAGEIPVAEEIPAEAEITADHEPAADTGNAGTEPLEEPPEIAPDESYEVMAEDYPAFPGEEFGEESPEEETFPGIDPLGEEGPETVEETPEPAAEAEDGDRKEPEEGAGEISSKSPPPFLGLRKNAKKQRGPYSVPVEGILNQYADGQYWIVDEETKQASRTLQETLSEFGIQAEVTGIRKGPVITMFEILPAPGVKLSKIVNLQDNIALRLAASSVRIVAPIPGKHAVGIEVPNKKRNIVSFREIIEGALAHRRENRRPEIPVVLGKGITGEAITADLTQMPHLLIAGSTGSGKSVCVNSLILSILFQLSPAECRLILIDPKIVELKLYNDIPHLLTPVITEPKRAFQALQYCIYEMERRYSCLDSMGVRDIKSYNRRIKERNIAAEHMPYIVVVIDEFADLMATTGKELESTVARLAAMSRAVGIHLTLATQRPSIDVITGLIKANIPSRIAFMVASKMDSRIIIDMVGAEKLLGKGDMLYAGVVDPFPIRMQGAFVSEEEVERVVEYVKSLGEPEYIDDEIFYDDEEDDTDPSLFSEGEDPLYEKALEVVLQQKKASASYIQRRLKIGYNRAARLVEEMEHRGVVGPAQGSKPRELLRTV
jgi:S-DNA-T family DNA segregation ATPase FtsK/SpoIIIE